MDRSRSHRWARTQLRWVRQTSFPHGETLAQRLRCLVPLVLTTVLLGRVSGLARPPSSDNDKDPLRTRPSRLLEGGPDRGTAAAIASRCPDRELALLGAKLLQLGPAARSLAFTCASAWAARRPRCRSSCPH